MKTLPSVIIVDTNRKTWSQVNEYNNIILESRSFKIGYSEGYQFKER